MTNPEEKDKASLKQSLLSLSIVHAVKDLASWLYVSLMLHLIQLTFLPSTAHVAFSKVAYLVLALYLLSYTVGHGFASGVFSRGEIVVDKLKIKGEHQVKGLAGRFVDYIENLALKVSARDKGDDTQSVN
jgi:hypothetical protein